MLCVWGVYVRGCVCGVVSVCVVCVCGLLCVGFVWCVYVCEVGVCVRRGFVLCACGVCLRV